MEKNMTFDRFLRFRLLEPRVAKGVFMLKQEGVLMTYIQDTQEGHEVTFEKMFSVLPGDLLEIEYPASYGYFLFGPNGDGKWKFTNKIP